MIHASVAHARAHVCVEDAVNAYLFVKATRYSDVKSVVQWVGRVDRQVTVEVTDLEPW